MCAFVMANQSGARHFCKSEFYVCMCTSTVRICLSSNELKPNHKNVVDIFKYTEITGYSAPLPQMVN